MSCVSRDGSIFGAAGSLSDCQSPGYLWKMVSDEAGSCYTSELLVKINRRSLSLQFRYIFSIPILNLSNPFRIISI